MTRCGKQSSGIQLKPLQKMGLPLTLITNSRPMASGLVSSSRDEGVENHQRCHCPLMRIHAAIKPFVVACAATASPIELRRSQVKA